MQLALAAAAKIFGGSAMAAGAAGATSGLSTVLSGVATAASILGTIGNGIAQSNQAKLQADMTDMQDGQDKLQSTQRQTEQKRALMQVLGENDVTFAAAGIDLTGGIAQSARSRATREANSQISIERQDSEFRSTLNKLRSRGLRSQAKSIMGGAVLGAIGTGANYGLSIAQQG